jgi:uncharacterized protein (TIGR03089 family)
MTLTPAAVLASMLRSDAGRPRLTFYDDTPGPTQGERIELSARVLANWVSKAANALQEEWDLGPGSRVRLDLPPHWRAAYWALATWSVGATLVTGPGRADLLVTGDPAAAEAADGAVALVTLAALARAATVPVAGLGPRVLDEARELATFGDQFAPWDEPDDTDAALEAGGVGAAYASVVPERDWPVRARVHTASPDLARVLLDSLGAWALDGSVVLSRGPAPAAGRAERLASEGVTVEL